MTELNKPKAAMSLLVGDQRSDCDGIAQVICLASVYAMARPKYPLEILTLSREERYADLR
jgi:hypothetical protein